MSQDLNALPQIKAALSVCAPVDLEGSSQLINRLWNKHYDFYYVHSLVKQLIERGLVDAATVAKKMPRYSLRNFDEYFTAPMAGFFNRDHYYESCAPKNVVNEINLPTVILAAADDPIVSSESIKLAPWSSKVQLALQGSGGHLGFLSREKTPSGDYRWMDYFILHWLELIK